MTHCYNCGHAGTFVLLVQFALAVPGPDARVPQGGPDHGGRGSSGRGTPDCGAPDRADPGRKRWPRCGEGSRRRDGSRRGNGSHCDADARRGTDSPRDASPERGTDSRHGNGSHRRDRFDRDSRLEPGDLPTEGGLSLAVQCPVCDSTDVGVAAADLLARYGSNTTS